MLLMLEYQNHHKIIINKVEEQEEMGLKPNVLLYRSLIKQIL